MQLYENNKETKDEKTNKILKISILGVSIFIVILIILIAIFPKNNPLNQSATIDGKIQNDIFKFIQYEDLGNDKVKLWISIKEIAPYLGYEAYNGNYNSATEDEDKCYIITEEQSDEDIQQAYIKEVTNFQANSNIISKLDLTSKDIAYEFVKLEDNVIEKDGNLYTTIEGIKKAYNVIFEYDDEKKQITIFTLPTLVEAYRTEIEKGTYTGLKKLDTHKVVNLKAILDGFLIGNSGDEGGNIKYGAIEIETKKIILEMKYDEIIYMKEDSNFLINTNKKYGIISEKGKTLIAPEYDFLNLIDSERELYLASKNNLYGVINGNGKEVIYIENEKIGVDINNFEKNEIKNGYILINKFIPVMKNKKWAIYDVSGNKISNYIYDEIGCPIRENSNMYGLIVIPEYNLLVVQKDKKYSFMDENGKTNILPFTFVSMYIKVEEGQLKYMMKTKSDKGEDEYSILNTLKVIFEKRENNTENKDDKQENVNNTEKNSTINNTTNNTKETNSSNNNMENNVKNNKKT